ncbi:hypothetical protein [Neobacillus bataviensis]|uniref:hypothetical protein n=1 Tax=Neobacillus bataviensis TaxID=220685 RepID=UPI001CBCEFB6|nr:hypothetical protein [Neobacillus bataviensis]
MVYERQIEDVVDALQKAKDDRIKVNLLIGAGCSVTGNIPTADGLINKIKELYPRDYKRANPKDYATCMSKITPIERRNLIMSVVKDSKVNWAHIAIAQLLKNNLVNRIITTNFDNLVHKACSLVGEFPAIYDLTTSKDFRTDLLFDKSVLHLHGQHTGFVLCNTGDEVNIQAQILKPVFDQLNQNSLWIVVGYSGNNDPIFQLLTEKDLFENRLFWVGYKDSNPNENLKKKLFSEEKYAFYIRGYDADSFFVLLAQKLGCFPPNFIKSPFTYLAETMETISRYEAPVFTQPNDFENRGIFINPNIQSTTKKVIQKAIDQIEKDSVLMAEHYILAGLYDEVIKLDNPDSENSDLEDLIISALTGRGEIDDLKQAETRLKNQIIKDDKAIYHDKLWFVYLKLAFSGGIDSPDICYLIQSYNEKLLSLELQNDRFLIILINRLLESIIDKNKNPRAKNKIPYGKIEELIESFLYIFDKNYSSSKFTRETQMDKEESFISLSFIYELIKDERFEMAEKALVVFDKYKEELRDQLPFLKANWGYWYFRNEKIEPYFAEENGKSNYEAALNIIFSTNSFRENNEVVFYAVKQKYLLENSRFLYRFDERENEAKTLLLEAISYGENSYSKYIYKEAIKLAKEKSLPQIEEVMQQVATGKID